jgi:hypothetical protein
MSDVTIRTLTEFTKFIEDNFGTEDVLCRGQDSKYPLLPSIARERLTDDVLEVEQYMVERLQRLVLRTSKLFRPPRGNGSPSHNTTACPRGCWTGRTTRLRHSGSRSTNLRRIRKEVSSGFSSRTMTTIRRRRK